MPAPIPVVLICSGPLGPIAFREADLDDSRTPKMSFAAAGAYNPERGGAAVAPATKATTLHHIAQGVVEATLRYRGLSLSNELHVRRQAIDGGPHVWNTGGFVQVGCSSCPIICSSSVVSPASRAP